MNHILLSKRGVFHNISLFYLPMIIPTERVVSTDSELICGSVSDVMVVGVTVTGSAVVDCGVVGDVDTSTMVEKV